jgi:glucose-1-phosphate thymidylyltransferase
MKGIILAGGAGSRLHPITLVTSKQLLPVYDKPMIYYPLSVLMSAGIFDILIITTPRDQNAFYELLGNGSQWGIRLTYASQPEPKGIAEAFIIGEHFIGDDKVSLILGDNLFWSDSLKDWMVGSGLTKSAVIFSQTVSNPECFGVIEKDKLGRILSIEEKPKYPKSNEVSVGLYIYEPSVVSVAKSLKPSSRLEYEITDINNHYINKGLLECAELKKGSAWLDTGSVDSLMDAAEFVKAVQKRQGILIGSPEEAAYSNGWISRKSVRKIADKMGKSSYAEHLRRL